MSFSLASPYSPKGDQPRAIEELVAGLRHGASRQTLLGATGTGKTFTMAHVIAELGRPALVMSHNKTLAAQLYGELKSFFPTNAVEYFISYYDYYQPEAYVPSTDTYIEKDSSINEDIERLRLRATSSLMERDDVIIVSSVSSIYGLGDPQEYRAQMLVLEVGQEIEAEGDPGGAGEHPVLAERRLVRARHLPGPRRHGGGLPGVRRAGRADRAVGRRDRAHLAVRPAHRRHDRDDAAQRHLPGDALRDAEADDRAGGGGDPAELDARLKELLGQNRLLEAQRLESRTNFDIEMMLEIGTCSGIENYSRHLTFRREGERPACLLDYFPEDFLVIVDESHVSVPQIGAMYNGDRARKTTLVEHGFRLPSALDNRPLKFEEWEQLVPKAVFVSATPGDYELAQSGGVVVEQIIRPTGLVDPWWRSAPSAGRWTTCWPRSASARSAASACW
jgi:excinuclease ABC subunit B